MIRIAKADGSAAVGWRGLSLVYGIFHAAGPGHGKAVISPYMCQRGNLAAQYGALVYSRADPGAHRDHPRGAGQRLGVQMPLGSACVEPMVIMDRVSMRVMMSFIIGAPRSEAHARIGRGRGQSRNRLRFVVGMRFVGAWVEHGREPAATRFADRIDCGTGITGVSVPADGERHAICQFETQNICRNF